VWQGRSWRLREERLLLSDGSVYVRGIVDHPGAVVLIPIEDDRIYMIRQYRPTLKQRILELPAGARDWEEDWLTCAQRELQEETGFQASRFEEIGRFWPSPGLSSEEMVVYLATGLTPAPLPPDPDEEIVVEQMAAAEVVEMVRDGRIRDGKTIVGISWAARHLGW
jgi:ADP-ribose pyrophosphatase